MIKKELYFKQITVFSTLIWDHFLELIIKSIYTVRNEDLTKYSISNGKYKIVLISENVSYITTSKWQHRKGTKNYCVIEISFLDLSYTKSVIILNVTKQIPIPTKYADINQLFFKYLALG